MEPRRAFNKLETFIQQERLGNKLKRTLNRLIVMLRD